MSSEKASDQHHGSPVPRRDARAATRARGGQATRGDRIEADPRTSASARGGHAARGDKSEAILQSALELFVERGFHGTAVPEVAERAGVGAGTIYRYFASKEALVNALFQREKGALMGWLLRDFPVDASAREQFRALWSRMAVFVAEKPLSFAFLELHNHASYLDDDSHSLEDRILEFGVNFVENAQRRGELREGPPLILIGLVLGAFTGLVGKAAQCGAVLDADTWSLAEQCMWEAIRI